MKGYEEPLSPKTEWTGTVGIGAHYSAEITRQALKLLENQPTDLKFYNHQWPGYVPPTRWQRICWAVSGYFSNLWDAICGRRDD